ncbi:AP-5 complex subunit zeta-1-like [Tubulanus polymorphus]|uniref:AP-5 complex subunit zeta-1-like n=1 Tax=Tubulanus polymorphus TaxID=672921 RepID=UPI003DA536C0
MAGVATILSQTSNLSTVEIKSYLDSLSATFETLDDSERITSLRQIILLVSTRQDVRIPKKLGTVLVKALVKHHESRNPFLDACIQIVLQHIPSKTIEIPEGRNDVSKVLNVIASKPVEQIDTLILMLLRIVSTQGFSLDTLSRALSLITSLPVLHGQNLKKEQVNIIEGLFIDWLLKASLEEASNPYKRNFFGKSDQPSTVTEIDGSLNRDFFTILNVGKYYTDDQLLNVHSFSVLKVWLQQQEMSDVKNVNKEFLETIIDYCFRVMDQAERKPKVFQDADVQHAVVIEAISILDSICKLETCLIPRVFQTVKRLHSKLVLAQDVSQPRILLALLQFFLNHSEAVVYDPQPFIDFYFDKVIYNQFGNSSVAFDTVMFIIDNLETLCFKTHIFKFFPNILKILAWNPRSYIHEFLEILPAMLSETTAIEVLHTLLDLPCMTAGLEVSCRIGKSDVTQSFTAVVEAMMSPMNRPLFNFILRHEGGHGDTIDRLNKLHVLLEDLNQLPRVVVCSQIVPVLIRLFFKVICDDSDERLAGQLVPVIIERVGLLYKAAQFESEIKKILADGMLMLFELYPKLLMQQHEEIRDYIGSLRHAVNNEEFFVHMVWIVGEYASQAYDSRCTSEVISQLYELLECVTYELSSILQNDTQSQYSVRLLAVLMTSQAKLASRCQDLIPRVILCLTKISQQKQKQSIVDDENDSRAIIDRANDLISILRIPNVAATILSPAEDVRNGTCHKNNTSLAIFLQNITELLQPSSRPEI